MPACVVATSWIHVVAKNLGYVKVNRPFGGFASQQSLIFSQTYGLSDHIDALAKDSEPNYMISTGRFLRRAEEGTKAVLMQ